VWGLALAQLWKTPIDAFGRAKHDSLVSDTHAPAQRSTYDEGTKFMRDLLDIMWQRHTCRATFDPQREIRESDMQCILDAARWAPTAHNMQNFEIIAVDDKQSLAAISAIQLPPAETFIIENYHQLSLSEAESLRSKTGLLASMLPESWQEAESAQDDGASVRYVGRTIQKCPLLLVVLTDSRLRAPVSEGDSLGLMSLGCVMQNLWLMTESLGISMQVLSAFSVNTVEIEVQRILAIPEHMKIAFAARLGYPVTASERYLRVRRKIQDFTHRNRYSVREPNVADGVA
jgi:nitroreductase